MENKSSGMRLTTVAEIVDAFGGTKAMAAWADVSQSAVSNWIARGWIPPDWYVAMSDELLRRGLEVTPETFRQVPAKSENPTAADA
jgi:hypothetical protein